MPNITVSIINQSTVVTDDDVRSAVADLQTQVSRDFAAAWGRDAVLAFVPSGSQPASGSWWLVILDNSDQAGALGYHDLTSEGLPLGKVFAGTDQQFGANWTVTASHELLEMLADPDVNLTAFVQSSDTTGRLYAYEVADACEADNYGYMIGNTTVSDFVFPAWFESFTPSGTQLDQQNQIQNPFQLLPGGYISVFDISAGSGWQQINGREARSRYMSRAHVGSRRERRRTPRTDWLKSGKPLAYSTARGESGTIPATATPALATGPASFELAGSEPAVHNVTGSSFADPADVATYERCKANGGSEEFCLGIGDNGIGAWGDNTKEGSGAACALSPEEMVATWGSVAAAHLQPVLITNPSNGLNVTAFIKDRLPHHSPRIDMNPDTCAALALRPPVLAPVTWQAASES